MRIGGVSFPPEVALRTVFPILLNSPPSVQTQFREVLSGWSGREEGGDAGANIQWPMPFAMPHQQG